VIILYATGLGYAPPVEYAQIPKTAAQLRRSAFTIQLDGAAVDPGAILYAGVAPGFAGLHQINLVLPASVGAEPAGVEFADSMSPAGVTLPVAP
jgi:uncharacterized protein (TIGR03437 family)